MKSKIYIALTLLVAISLVFSCDKKPSSHGKMVALLKEQWRKAQHPENEFEPMAKVKFTDSLARVAQDEKEILYIQYLRAFVFLEMGETEKSIETYKNLLGKVNQSQAEMIEKDLALANFRLAETTNCVSNHATASCILPIKGNGIHTDTYGSRMAIQLYTKVLERNVDLDLEALWMLNLAYMTLGEYPKGVPPKYLIPGMGGDTTYKVNAFQDIAEDLGLAINNMAGGSIIEDFDNDGYLDLLLSGWGTADEMRYYKNEGNGKFTEVPSTKTGLKGITGGLNMMQTDYNNDGFKDVFVVRGGWKMEFGKDPNSLLKK